ncbi:unnamed protein product [Urochloa humidicola]
MAPPEAVRTGDGTPRGKRQPGAFTAPGTIFHRAAGSVNGPGSYRAGLWHAKPGARSGRSLPASRVLRPTSAVSSHARRKGKREKRRWAQGVEAAVAVLELAASLEALRRLLLLHGRRSFSSMVATARAAHARALSPLHEIQRGRRAAARSVRDATMPAGPSRELLCPPPELEVVPEKEKNPSQASSAPLADLHRACRRSARAAAGRRLEAPPEPHPRPPALLPSTSSPLPPPLHLEPMKTTSAARSTSPTTGDGGARARAHARPTTASSPTVPSIPYR